MAEKKLIKLVALAASLVVPLPFGAPLASAQAGGSKPGPLPSLDSADLAQGRHSSMSMMLKKTFLRIKVASIDVRFDRQAQTRFAELARGKPYSEALEQQLAQVAIGAGRAVVQMRFERDIPLDRWIGVVRDNLDQAREAGLITRELMDQVSRALPQSFAALQKRGYEKGDRLLYAIAPDSLRTVVASAGGQVLLDRMDRDLGVRRVVMASYFAPGSDYREPLLRSLVEGGR
jgi:hypothetical protein